jgi:shikimate dehydrogenase
MPLHAQRPSILVGLIGRDIQASRSPEMHMREGEAQGLRLIYNLIDLAKLDLSIESLPDLLVAAERTGFAGLNVTIPCKQAIIPYLHELSDDARALGAVNTVVLRDGRRIGHNTDWSGFAEGFRRGLPNAPMGLVVQLGAGGAGAAVAHAALMLGTKLLMVFDTEPSRAAQLASDLSARFGPGRAVAATDVEAAMASADGLINCTPIGMANYPGTSVPVALLRPAMWVSEIIYFPLETELLRAARALGCRTVDGGGMAVFQAVHAFRLFTGIEPDHERMLRHFASIRPRELHGSNK